MVFHSKSTEETQKFARKLAGKFQKTGGILALAGDLGSGKTTFAQGFAKGLGIKEKVISPTFILIRHHKIPSTQKVFYHIDLYRLDGESDIKHAGIKEILDNIYNNVVLIEWAEKIAHLLPKSAVKIQITKLAENGRKFDILNL